MPNNKFDPTWKKYEDDMRSEDASTSVKAGEAFLEERAKELQNSRAARDWENSRKERLAKDKPQWVKKKRAQEQEVFTSLNKNLKSAGMLDTGLIPAPGYLIVKVDEAEEKTDTGIFLAPISDDAMQNTGVVISRGEEMPTEAQYYWPCVAKEGDHIMFKKGAGLDVTLKGEKCRFMLFSEILGVLTE